MFDQTADPGDGDLATFPGRRAPHNIEAEMGLLGAILVNPRAFERIANFLKPQHFALAEHRRIFETCAEMAGRGELVDSVTLKSALDNRGTLDQVGGPGYLNRLVDCAVTVINAGEYGRLIRELALRREAIEVATTALDSAYAETEGVDLADLGERLRGISAEIAAGGGGGACLPFVAPGETALKTCAWLVKGLIPKTGMTFIYGPSGAGKSFVAVDIAMAISRGEPWRGRKAQRGAVLYLSPDGGGVFENRLIAYAQRHGLAHGDHQVFSVTCGVDLLAAGAVETVQRTIASIERGHQVGVAAVVVDTASRAMPGADENAAKDVTRLVENLGRIGDGKRAVIAVHHSGKDLGQGMRGHSALYAAADSVIRVNDGAIETVKSRDGAGGMVGGFKLDVVELGLDEDGEPITSCVVVETDASRHVGKSKMSATDHVALRTISNLIAEHGEPLPQGTGFPTQSRHNHRHFAVSVGLVSRALRGSLFAERKADAAQKAWERLRTKLHSAGLIGLNGGLVWLPDPPETDGHRHFADMSEMSEPGIPDDEKPTDTDTPLKGCRMSVVGRSPTPEDHRREDYLQ